MRSFASVAIDRPRKRYEQGENMLKQSTSRLIRVTKLRRRGMSEYGKAFGLKRKQVRQEFASNLKHNRQKLGSTKARALVFKGYRSS